MKTIDCINTDNWIFTKSKPIGSWEFYKKISCPDFVDTDKLYSIISNEEKEKKWEEQEEWRRKQEPEPEPEPNNDDNSVEL